MLPWRAVLSATFGAIGHTLAHGVVNNVKLKAAGLCYGYNSGLATAILGHVPLCIAYGYLVERNGLTSGWDCALGFTCAVFAYVVVFNFGIMKTLKNVNSPYPFDATELRRFDKLYGC